MQPRSEINHQYAETFDKYTTHNSALKAMLYDLDNKHRIYVVGQK